MSEKKWYVGSLSGERFQSTAKRGSPRRKLPDGRTETGLEVAEPEMNPIVSADGDLEINIDEDIEVVAEPPMVELEDLLTPQEFDSLVGELDVDSEPTETQAPPEFEQTRQAPKTTQKDVGKMQHVIAAAMSLMQPEPLTKEQKIELIALLWADTMDVRIQTSQTVLSTKHYALIAGALTVAILLKGSTGFKFPKMRGRQTKIEDAFAAMDRDDDNQH